MRLSETENVVRKEPLIVMCPKCRRILFKGTKAELSIKCDKCHDYLKKAYKIASEM